MSVQSRHYNDRHGIYEGDWLLFAGNTFLQDITSRGATSNAGFASGGKVEEDISDLADVSSGPNVSFCEFSGDLRYTSE